MADEPLVSAEEMASVLSNDDAQVKEVDGDDGRYSLRRPAAIPREAEAEARQRVERLVARLQKTVTAELGSGPQLELTGFRQQQVRVAITSIPAPAWVLSLALRGGGGVMLVLEASCALALVELALGGSADHKGDSREPTALESRVMGGMATTFAREFSRRSGDDFDHGSFDVGAVPGRVATPGETVGGGLLKIRLNETEFGGLLLVSSCLLRDADEPIATPRTDSPMAERLRRVAVLARPTLRGGRVPLADLLRLQPGTVLKLDAPEDRLLELRIGDDAPLVGSIRRGDEGSAFGVVWRRSGTPRHQAAVTPPAGVPSAESNEGEDDD